MSPEELRIHRELAYLRLAGAGVGPKRGHRQLPAKKRRAIERHRAERFQKLQATPKSSSASEVRS